MPHRPKRTAFAATDPPMCCAAAPSVPIGETNGPSVARAGRGELGPFLRAARGAGRELPATADVCSPRHDTKLSQLHDRSNRRDHARRSHSSAAAIPHAGQEIWLVPNSDMHVGVIEDGLHSWRLGTIDLEKLISWFDA
jgi:hypothetical protein